MIGLDLLQLDEDREYLERRQLNCTIQRIQVGNGHETHIVFHDFALPARYTPRSVDLLVRIPPGYPEIMMDMFWTRPDVTLVENGAKPQATETTETHQGLSWQRWSRHINTWRPEIDRLENFMQAIFKELSQ